MTASQIDRTDGKTLADYTQAEIDRALIGGLAYPFLWKQHADLHGYEQLNDLFSQYADHIFSEYRWADEALGQLLRFHITDETQSTPIASKIFAFNALAYMNAYLVLTTPPSCKIRPIWYELYQKYKHRVEELGGQLQWYDDFMIFQDAWHDVQWEFPADAPPGLDAFYRVDGFTTYYC